MLKVFIKDWCVLKKPLPFNERSSDLFLLFAFEYVVQPVSCCGVIMGASGRPCSGHLSVSQAAFAADGQMNWSSPLSQTGFVNRCKYYYTLYSRFNCGDQQIKYLKW